MNLEDRKKFSGIAMWMGSDKIPETTLLRHCSKNKRNISEESKLLLKEALEKNIIEETITNDKGEKLYKLTQKGRELLP